MKPAPQSLPSPSHCHPLQPTHIGTHCPFKTLLKWVSTCFLWGCLRESRSTALGGWGSPGRFRGGLLDSSMASYLTLSPGMDLSLLQYLPGRGALLAGVGEGFPVVLSGVAVALCRLSNIFSITPAHRFNSKCSLLLNICRVHNRLLVQY